MTDASLPARVEVLAALVAEIDKAVDERISAVEKEMYRLDQAIRGLSAQSTAPDPTRAATLREAGDELPEALVMDLRRIDWPFGDLDVRVTQEGGYAVWTVHPRRWFAVAYRSADVWIGQCARRDGIQTAACPSQLFEWILRAWFPAPQPPEPSQLGLGSDVENELAKRMVHIIADRLQALLDERRGVSEESDLDRGIRLGLEAAMNSLHFYPVWPLTSPPQPPEPEPVENSAAPTIDLESVVSDIFLLVEPVSSDDHSDAEMARVLEQVRALVDKTLGPKPPPADGLVEAAKDFAMILRQGGEGSAAYYRAMRNLTHQVDVHELERERAKEGGRG